MVEFAQRGSVLPQQLSLSTPRSIPQLSPFAHRVLTWFDQYGRKDLPWQDDRSAYRVWISEIMLQQTQVNTVIPYFLKFMQRFPTVYDLANAEQDEVLKYWSGLGYYARARNLHKAAQRIRDDYQGEFPTDIEAVIALSGIGKSTAGAILSIAYQQSHAILDGNVKRVLARYYTIEGWTGSVQVQKQLWQYAEQLLPDQFTQKQPERNRDYTQAMMDLGATLCTRSKPNCAACPLSADCQALQRGKVTDYPQPKPKKVLPQRCAILLILQNPQGEVLLEKRPPIGIWGGLWSFPQFETQQQAEDWLLDHYALDFNQAEHLPERLHTFSHFRLTIRPCLLQIESTKQGIMEAAGQLWYNTHTEFSGGLAAPITTLLKTMKRKKL
jgi:A/G-specific adenine glycosylase